MRRNIPRYLFGIVLLGLYQYSQYWFDTRLAHAINLATSGESSAALEIGIWLAAVSLVAFGIRVLSRVVVFNAGRISEYELRSALLGHIHKLGPSFFQRMPVGEVMSRATNDLTHVRLLLGFGALNAVNTVFALVSAAAVTLSISVPLTLAAMSPIPLLFYVTRRFSLNLYGRQKGNQDALGKMSAMVQTSISGARVVRAFDLEADQTARFEEVNSDYLEKSLDLARVRGSMGPVMQGITSIGLLVVFWYGGILLVRGEIDGGGFLAFFRALGRLTWPLMALGFLVGLVQRGRAAYSRLSEIFATQPDIEDGPLPAPAEVKGSLSVRHLSYSIGDRPILRDVSFELPVGSSVAIVGKTGCGKSSLARLLPRLLPTPPGTVFLDGVDVCDLPLRTVRKAIGYAQQDPFLFSTTAAENIALALEDVDPKEKERIVKEAARRAHVLDELLSLPDGLDTVVGERGVQLSGGQKQRVALGAAFVLGPQILVLDDPLSAVDARTERGILEAIDEQRAERGVILITHRVVAAERCDRILVLDEGKIVESGTHAELLAHDGLYAAFAREQRLEGELARLAELEIPAAPLPVSP
ncbi:MAG: carbohydrate ABC transporter [Sorangiineae bacterium NIC37A_2]|nr:MAG: carbohydrate ABC transporter [Sorangiineae bacterium NIC37A_2]